MDRAASLDLTRSIREAALDDLTVIYTNERLCYPHPWTQRMIENSLIGDHLCLVMEENNCIVGHMILELVLDEVHLYNVCVLPKHQGQGRGKKWIDYLYQFAANHKASKIHLEVRVSNQAALRLYMKRGFERIGYRKNYYRSSNDSEDAIIMVAQLLP